MNVLSGISSRPLSVEAMIATCFTADDDPLVCDLGYIVEVVFKAVCTRTLGMSGQMFRKGCDCVRYESTRL